jgi:hypothetical protein
MTDVEEIAHKTGNYKRFVVFVKMLVSALTQPSDRLFAELLTLQDLVSNSSSCALSFIFLSSLS